MIKKALLILLNSNGEIFLQDRSGHRPPPWGFFGGSIEAGESPQEAVLRETEEELNIKLSGSDVEFVGRFDSQFEGEDSERYFFLYQTDRETFEVLEGAGGKWMDFEEAEKRLVAFDRLRGLQQMINQLMGKKN